MPVRVQLSRAKGWRMPANTVVVARPSKYGNPWQEGDPGLLNYGGWIKLPMALTRAGVVDRYRRWLAGEFQTPSGAIRMDHPIYECVVAPPRPEWATDPSDLRGKNLACWCKLPAPGEPDICHAAVLLALANAPLEQTAEPAPVFGDELKQAAAGEARSEVNTAPILPKGEG